MGKGNPIMGKADFLGGSGGVRKRELGYRIEGHFSVQPLNIPKPT